jgi:hypothetical protein
MKSTTLSISELATAAPRAIRETEEMGIRGITRNGKAVAFLISRNTMESILETMELQRNPELMELVKEHKAGRIKFTPLADEE